MRTKNKQILEAVNCSSDNNLITIPVDVMCSKIITSKAKVILSILLSKNEGISSFMNFLLSSMKESRNTILEGLRELEETGYLFRLKYRDNKTKIFKGTLFVYSNKNKFFEKNKLKKMLQSHGMEPIHPRTKKPYVDFWFMDFFSGEKSALITELEPTSSTNQKTTRGFEKKRTYIYNNIGEKNSPYKINKEKPSKKSTNKIIPPKIESIKEYCDQRKNNIDPNYFYDFYQSKNWMIGKNKMVDWQAAVRTWERKDKTYNKSNPSSDNSPKVPDYVKKFHKK